MATLDGNKTHNIGRRMMKKTGATEAPALHVTTPGDEVPAYLVDAIKILTLCSLLESACDIYLPCALSLLLQVEVTLFFPLLELIWGLCSRSAVFLLAPAKSLHKALPVLRFFLCPVFVSTTVDTRTQGC